MKALVGTALATTLVAALPNVAQAQGYFSFFGGASHLSNGQDAAREIDTRYDNGWLVGAALGHRVGAVRLEGELGYRRNDASNMTFSGGAFTADGPLTAWTGMFNVFYDFSLTGMKPFVGGGVGMARFEADHTLVGVPTVDSKDTVMAYQLGAGLAFAIAQGREIVLEYRYFASRDPTFTDVDGEAYRTRYRAQSISVAFRCAF
jgi:opacity protein-like surface antigen